ncbi:unnamed protein product [Phyllotreta striolata]|uniref:Ribosomal protein L1 n=1 Tax=Phyllotreta striolata TaxID=444603 RepID=A0A9N9TM43_PHYSR|nr:unnamed protein product [Phyllotreta striolata]
MNTLSFRGAIQTAFSKTLQTYIMRSSIESNFIQTREYAARKGTRERRKKNKVKVEIQKLGFLERMKQHKEQKLLAEHKTLKFDDSMKRDPVDDVFVMKYYKWIVYPFQEALKCHRETHSPEMYNKPDSMLRVNIELNMIGEKKTRLLDNFSSIVHIPHKFEHKEERSIVAFSKSPENQAIAAEAGAQLSGGLDLIKQIQTGEISLADYKFIVAHPEILPELVALRGVMKKRFPNPKTGTLSVDLASAVYKFLHGISYTAKKNDYEKEFGLIETAVGPLSMDSRHLEENFAALVRDVYTMKPKRPGTFISRCILWSEPSPELLKVDHEVYLKQDESIDDDEEIDDKGETVAL